MEALENSTVGIARENSQHGSDSILRTLSRHHQLCRMNLSEISGRSCTNTQCQEFNAMDNKKITPIPIPRMGLEPSNLF